MSSLHIGFQGCSFGPFYFTTSDNAVYDVGFLKLFVSTCQVDLGSIAQGSPFLPTNVAAREEAGSPARSGHERGAGRQRNPVIAAWDEICYAVIVRRDATAPS